MITAVWADPQETLSTLLFSIPTITFVGTEQNHSSLSTISPKPNFPAAVEPQTYKSPPPTTAAV